MKIKVCGMREASNMMALSGLEPDYMGLIFYPASKRYVEHVDANILEDISSQVKIAGVFVNAEASTVIQKVGQFHLKAIQLHGDESPAYCHALRSALDRKRPGIELIKAFGIHETFDFSILEDYRTAVDFFLFDTRTPAHGGSGIKFNWQLLEKYQLDKPYFLSGGIDLMDVEQVRQLKYPALFAVDLNSKFESAPGMKDIEQVRKAIDIIRKPLALIND